ncbi:hypothetical protein HK104_001511 [Borealophlyctis nickersoniae]|nr:hypothetical protein HK104_001511 [Borealophlyctis nickersoniae]
MTILKEDLIKSHPANHSFQQAFLDGYNIDELTDLYERALTKVKGVRWGNKNCELFMIRAASFAKRNLTYVSRMREVLGSVDRGISVIGWERDGNAHWTCVVEATPATLKVRDGDKKHKEIRENNSTVSGQERTKHYNLIPDEVIFITRTNAEHRKVYDMLQKLGCEPIELVCIAWGIEIVEV